MKALSVLVASALLLAFGTFAPACTDDGRSPTPGSGDSTADVEFDLGNDAIDGRAVQPVRTASGALQVTESVYMAPGFADTFLVVTDEGNVVIDTASETDARSHRDMLRQVDDGPVRYIVLTHAHFDHTGGVSLWREDDTEVVAQRNHVEFLHYQHRLRGFFARRDIVMFPWLAANNVDSSTSQDAEVENYGGTVLADTLFDDAYQFELGGLTFQIFHTPGETYDQSSVWIPQLKIAFTGDNYYEAFPNIYTLRGTRPRWALDWVESLDEVIGWEAEILAPGHGSPVYGSQRIAGSIRRYRDAILYVHDETVRGMNAGVDVYTLMQQIALPPDLAVGEYYGKVPWTVRGIYEGYVGWFDSNPSNMYPTPPSAAYPELVRMAGGAEAVARRAAELIGDGRTNEGLHLADIALEADPDSLTALKTRANGFASLLDRSANLNESAWLAFGIGEARRRIDELAR